MKKITFGRLPDNDSVLDDQSVSRHHGYLMESGGEEPPAAVETLPEGEETPEESGGEPESKES